MQTVSGDNKIRMKCEKLFSGRNKKHVISLSSAELALRVMTVTIQLCLQNYTFIQYRLKYDLWNPQDTANTRYNDSILFPKTLPLKWICCCIEYLMSRLIYKKGPVLFLFPHRTYVLDIC